MELMVDKKKRPNLAKKANTDQKLYLISYMESDMNFAHDKYMNDHGRQTNNTKWDELASELNKMKGSTKSVDQWKRYWCDIKMNSKKRAVQLRLAQEKTGSTGENIKKLSDTDSRVIGILSWDSIDGDGQTQEVGLPLPTLSMRPTNTVILDDDSDISDEREPAQKTKVKNNATTSTSSAAKSSNTLPKSHDISTGVSSTAAKFYKEANENEYKKAHALMEIASQMKEANNIKKIKLQILKEQTEAIKNLSQSVNTVAEKFTQP